ncbi:PREDICTED: cysteine-rich receptor-like protein kinase 1 [Tarenaya hassleriana]|uniref:cysteine-rich receptor-like protein kinase 1 n=1 Tax=Tarenaya hassleriana TaxID=28532 RepID=UPI00053C6BEC|nr:PREDICTED: cysteine-rich receptor-like protein kinase 1 [Tarenaya hassleriana]
MPFSSTSTHFLVWISFPVLVIANFSSASVPGTLFCNPLDQPANVRRLASFFRAMATVTDLISDDKLWVYSSSSDQSPSIYFLVQCHEDLSVSACRNCLNESKSELETNCLGSNWARIHRDGCFLRFDNRDFSKENLDALFDQVKCSNAGSSIAFREFESDLDHAFVNVTLKAVRNGGFGVAVASSGEGHVAVYALAQCWHTLDENSCRDCLVTARSSMMTCNGKEEATAFFTGCYLKYSTRRFFDEAAEHKHYDGKNGLTSSSPFPVLSQPEIIKLTIAVVSLSILTCLGVFLGYKRFSKKRKAHNPSCSNFKYEILEKATEFFSDSMKLGQGGAGSVYKGDLPDGRTVAVKKLFFNTRQWADQFFNEVNLISGIEHKNVVRLLGCSIEGPESLLVYEYVPNRSLDQILFVKNTVHILSWKQRLNIITGIAEGLEYLHGGCGVKIIHRDIKTGNVLLDQNLTPKIADFGLARSVGPDKTYTNTGIAGTLGYLAPEYLIKGQLTEKTDVYAFGVLILEIATGKKNSAFTKGANSVLYSVWEHFEANALTRSVDPRLKGKFPEEETSKVLQIGLLCVQSSVAMRPSMSEIVAMLKNRDCECPFPKQPPFLSSTVLMSNEDTRLSQVINT